MAVVLDAFASYIQTMLTEMVKEEAGMLLGVSGEIDKMGVKLKDLQNFLVDADKRRITEETVQQWVSELRGIMYDGTDILEVCLLKAMEQKESYSGSLEEKLAGCIQPLLLCLPNPNILGGSAGEMLSRYLNPLLFCVRNPLFVHDIGTRIKMLNQRLESINKRGVELSFIRLNSYEERSKARPSAANRKTDPVLGHSGVVGEKIEEDTRALVEKLTADSKTRSNNVMVAAIVGVGGIGKTTLAKKVFNDEAIQHKFDKKIWLSVTKDFHLASLLKTIIIAAEGNLPAASCEDESLLISALHNAIRGKKLFLVLDDLWRATEWENLLEGPLSHCAHGSRVLITTRDERVARDISATLPDHHVDRLRPEDAWSLLKYQVVRSTTDDAAHIDMLKDIGVRITAKCDGLPLAVKVIGGLLRKKERNPSDWEEVLNDPAWSGAAKMPKELNNAVYLSYEDMDSCQKQCFLHYSLLPKDILFDDEIIVGMWISEGFLDGSSQKELEAWGRECYKELIARNLIEPNELYIDQQHCTMHDIVRSFGQYMCRDESLVAHTGDASITSKLNSQKFRRLSIGKRGSRSHEYQWSMLRAQGSLRTLISIGELKIKPGDSLVVFPSLRILHIESANVDVLLDTLYQLKHLRYLSIRCSDLSRLPENIGEIKLLQLIQLGGCHSLTKLPGSIVKLGQLRYLSLVGTSTESGIPRGFRGLTNMRKLYGFSAHTDGDWCSLEDLGPLSQLRALGLYGLENVPVSSSVTKARLGEKVHLTSLSLNCSTRLGDDGMVKQEGVISKEEQQLIEEVFDELCPPPSLDTISIQGYFGGRLPKWMMSTSAADLMRLRTVIMLDLACCTQLPDGLCRLPYLQSIQINRAPAIKKVGPEFLDVYHHHHSSQVAAAFPRLVRMLLVGMLEWEEWEWEEQVRAMPVLEVLVLRSCKLKHVPPGLASHARVLTTLCIQYVNQLSSVENLASVDYLEVYGNPDLEKITNLPKLRKLTIVECPNMKVLEGVPSLQRLMLEDGNMVTLPEYISDVNPRHLQLQCSLALVTSIYSIFHTGKPGHEWGKFNHIEHVKAYAKDRSDQTWFVMYTRHGWISPTGLVCNFQSNISESIWRTMMDAEEHVSNLPYSRLGWTLGCGWL